MRVIAGKSAGRRLKSLDGKDTRPTAERVKEGIFSAVNFLLPGAKVLDVFSGTGQLGIEALSRGAVSCTFCDSSKEACLLIKENLQHIGFFEQSKVLNIEAENYLKYNTEKFEIIFFDAPYKQDFLAKTLPLLVNVLADGGVIMAESERGLNIPEPLGVFVKKQYIYGSVCVTRFEKPLLEE